MPTLDVDNMGSGISIRIDHSNHTDDPGIELSYSGSGNGIFVESTTSSNNEAGIKVNYVGTGYAGYFNGDVYTTGSYLPSDARWKQNILPIENALRTVSSLRGVQFEWNREEHTDRGYKAGNQYGFIAQEMEEILPELVRDDQDGYKSVDYQKITAFLVEAVKEQQKQIEELKANIVTLQAQSDMASTD